MKKILSLTLCTAFFAVCFSGCVIANFWGTAGSAVTGKGELEKYNFNLGGFNSIKVDGYCEIHYYAGYSDTVTLEVQPNLREYYRIEVANGELVVRTTRRVNINSGKIPVLTVFAPVLNHLVFSGAGSFTAHDTITASSFTFRVSGAGKGKASLNVNNLVVDISGAGSLELSGTADTAELILSGAGEVNALSLQTRETAVSLSGTGRVRINCLEHLHISAAGAGTVEYKGSPVLNLSRSGMASVRKVD